MAWTYDNTDISTDLAKVRLRVGDTNPADKQFTDEEIAHYLTEGGSVARASLALCKAAIGKYARYTDHSNQGISTSRSAMIQHYRDLIQELTEETESLAIAVVPALSLTTRESWKANTDRPQPVFDHETDTNNG